MAIDISLPTWPVVFATAAVDSINPCAIGVLILLIATLLSLSHNRRKMLWVGIIYIATVFVTYLIAGFGLLFFIQRLNIADELSWLVGGLVVFLGILEVKDFFWYGRGLTLQIPAKRLKQIKKYMHHVTIPSAVVLGAFVAAVELPCTGGPYLAITTLLAKVGFTLEIFWLLVVYNFIFVLPLIVILILAYFGVSTKKMKDWKNKEKRWMRLAIGLVLIALGAILILWGNGWIGLTLT